MARHGTLVLVATALLATGATCRNRGGEAPETVTPAGNGSPEAEPPSPESPEAAALPVPEPSGTPPSAEAEDDPLEPCRALRDRLVDVIHDDEEDHEAWRALNACLGTDRLVGMTRAEIEGLLGPGTSCREYCPGHDLGDSGRYYEIGRLPEGWVGGVPNLVLDFDDEGRCILATTIHTQ